ncbi:uncharacterized protein LOC113466822 [Diaphorina citri]|uniref:Uncharacterized protein LOC113466822 n=1 Tax=Diaphorina citri TaxID=121845 RepID=A0A3Q0IVD4_DIACI|nr:uncharacterized protein LOC113466822 [Diaphorina citri]
MFHIAGIRCRSTIEMDLPLSDELGRHSLLKSIIFYILLSGRSRNTNITYALLNFGLNIFEAFNTSKNPSFSIFIKSICFEQFQTWWDLCTWYWFIGGYFTVHTT